MSISLDDAAVAIVAAGRYLDGRGWAPATAGNYSVRLDGDRVAITASGRDKGALTVSDVITVDFDGRPLQSGVRPSAETLLHVGIYRDLDWAGAVLHTHSVTSTVLGMADSSADEIVFSGYELLKAFPGFDSHDGAARIAMLENTQDMPKLAAEASRLMRRNPGMPGFLIRGHGLYTWGQDMTAARRHVEALEFLMACELERKRIGR